MPIYRVTISVSYEGEWTSEFSTLVEAATFIREQQASNPGRSLDDYEIVEVGQYVDVYELMRQHP